MPRAELFDGTILDFEEGTPNEVIHRVALEQTERIRSDQARKPLPEGVTPGDGGAGRGKQGAPTAEELAAAAPRAPAEPAPMGDPMGSGAETIGGSREAFFRRGSVLDEPLPERLKDPQPEKLSDAELQQNVGLSESPIGTARRKAQERARGEGAPVFKDAGSFVAPTGGVLDAAMKAPGMAVRGLGESALTIGAVLADYGIDTGPSADEYRGAAKKLRAKNVTALEGLSDKALVDLGPLLSAVTPSARTVGEGLSEVGRQAALNLILPGGIILDAGFKGVDEAHMAGMNPGAALLMGVLKAGTEGVPEHLSAKFSMEKGAGIKFGQMLQDPKIAVDAVKRFGAAMGVELTSEEASAVSGWAVDKLALDPTATLDRIGKDMTDAIKATLIQAPGMMAFGKIAAIAGETTGRKITPYDIAAVHGFNVKPILDSDAPDVQRTKTVGFFQSMAAEYGIPDAAVKRAKEAAKELPLEQVGPFLDRLVDTLTAKNLVAKPIDEPVRALLTLPPLSEAQADQALAKIEKQGAEDVKALRDFRPETKPAADEAIAAAPASEPAKTETVSQEGGTLAEPIDGDILTKAGNPFATERSAKRALEQNPGHEIVAVQGGFAVRKAAPRETPIDLAATEAATHPSNDLREPTEAQKEAENYKVGHDNVTIPGERLSIENGAGSTRSGTSPDGKAWETEMQDHYGRILGTVGMDSTPEKPQHVDFFAKAGTPEGHTGPVFIVDQVDPKTGKPDEHKVMFGYDSLEQARTAYLSHYEKGWKGLGAITETTLDDFKQWAHSDATSRPYGSAQPDVQPTPAEPATPVSGGADQPGGRGRDLGPGAGGAVGQGEPAAAETVPGSGGDLALEPRGGEPGAVERRGDAAARKRVGEMTPEELRAALHTDDLTGLRNGRWLNEHIDDFSHIVAFDADSLKFINDTMGHESGDALLKAWGEALKTATPNSARAGGDEFFSLANSQEEAESIAERVREILSAGSITAETPDGETITIKGIGVSFGIGTSKKAADEKLNQHKRAREAAGERAGRGETPPGTNRAPTQRQQDQVGAGEREDVQGLTEDQAFEADYAHFDGRTVEQPVRLSDTGQTATLKMDAAKAMRALDSRLKALQELRTCIGRSA